MRFKSQVGFKVQVLHGANACDTAYPDPREDLESRSPNLGPYTTKGTS